MNCVKCPIIEECRASGSLCLLLRAIDVTEAALESLKEQVDE